MVKPGSVEPEVEVERSFVDLLTGSDLFKRRLPYIQVRAATRGPTVWLTACCHGDEVGGIVVVQEVFKRLPRLLRRGRVHAFPLMNPLGFEAAARHVTLSEEDLNRAFPGSARGTLAERIAHRIYRRIVATSPTLVLDLHNDWIRSVPYTLLDAPTATVASGVYDATLAHARVLGFPIVEETTPLRHTLSHSLLQAGIAALTVELGESQVVNERHVRRGAGAILRVLSRLGMVELPEGAHMALEPVEHLRYGSEPASNKSGILRFLVAPGEWVRAGQPLARVYDAFGDLEETLRAPGPALVLGLNDSAVAYPGAPVVAMGLQTRG